MLSPMAVVQRISEQLGIEMETQPTTFLDRQFCPAFPKHRQPEPKELILSKTSAIIILKKRKLQPQL